MGRPFRGSVTDTSGKEQNVVIKRSIFRLIKKIFGRDDYLEVLGPQIEQKIVSTKPGLKTINL